MAQGCWILGTLAVLKNTPMSPLFQPVFRKSTVLVICGLGSLTGLRAQQFYGLNNSNFNGVHGMYINPSSIADGRFSRHINISTFGAQFSNDYLNLEIPFSLRDLVNGTVPDDVKNPSGQIRWNNAWLKENLDGKPKNAYFGLEWRGPAGMTKLTDRFAVGFGMRTRLALSATNLDENFARTARSGFDTGYLRSFTSDNSFHVNMNSTQEISGTAAMVLINKKSFYLKVGGSLKMMFGIGNAQIQNNGLELDLRQPDSIRINRIDMSVGYSNPEFLNSLRNGILSASLPKFDVNGFGLGYDLGATWEWRPKVTEGITSGNKYQLRVAASLLDLGGIRYSRNSVNYSVQRSTPHTFTEHGEFNRAFDQGIDSGLNWVKGYAQEHFNYKEENKSYTVALPSMFCLQADYNLFRFIYLGLNWNQSFVNREEISFRRPSSIVLLPRFETKLLEFSLPMSLYNDYTDASVGLFARLGPVFVGTDDLVRSLNRSSFNGFNFYFGVSSGLPARKKKKS